MSSAEHFASMPSCALWEAPSRLVLQLQVRKLRLRELVVSAEVARSVSGDADPDVFP